MTNSATSSSKGAADSLITPKPRSSSLSYTRLWVGEVHAGVLPLNRANLVAACPLLEAERHVIVAPLVQTIRVHCCFLYAVSEWIFYSSSVLEMTGVINWLFTLSIFKTQ